MEYIFYDTETTGFTRCDEVIQFSGFVTDENLKLKSAIDFYCYTQVPINKKALEVHGINASALWKLSGGKTFEDQFYDSSISKKNDLVWVSYSTSGFDERLVNQTLKNNGLPGYDFGSKITYFGQETNGIHTMEFYKTLKNRCFDGRDKKLVQAVQDAGFSKDQAESLFRKVLKKEGTAVFHNALFDAFSLYLLAMRYKRELGLSEI